MRVISLKVLRDFWGRHPDAESWLRQWYKTAIHADWSSLHEARLDYPRADSVTTRGGETLTVFNVCGNKYRLIVRIRYEYRLVNVRAMLTHKAYGEGKWRD
jgi:mRNA interferase HigB